MWQRIGIGMITTLAAALAPSAHGQAPLADGVVRVGSWNIEHLGDPQARRSSGEGVAQDARDLARYLLYANVDVLAVQEITADEAGPAEFPPRFRTSRILTETLALVNQRSRSAWKHVLFPKARPADRNQWTGVAWNSARVQTVGDIFQVPVSHQRSSKDSNLWDRNLHALLFSAGKGKTDFVVLPLHLKANTSASYARHRAEEVADLVGKLTDVAKFFRGEQDLVILGDTNIQSAQEEAVRLLEEAGFKDLNKHDADTHQAKGIQPFARIFVPRAQPEFARSSMEALVEFQKRERLSFAEYRARYSDHYVVATTLRIMNDDD
jgi:predicted extracellular nuclease